MWFVGRTLQTNGILPDQVIVTSNSTWKKAPWVRASIMWLWLRNEIWLWLWLFRYEIGTRCNATHNNDMLMPFFGEHTNEKLNKTYAQSRRQHPKHWRTLDGIVANMRWATCDVRMPKMFISACCCRVRWDDVSRANRYRMVATCQQQFKLVESGILNMWCLYSTPYARTRRSFSLSAHNCNSNGPTSAIFSHIFKLLEFLTFDKSVQFIQRNESNGAELNEYWSNQQLYLVNWAGYFIWF